MNRIHLRQTLPQVFADRDAITSDVWHRDITFHKGKRYLIEAASGTGKSSLCSYVYGYRNDYQGIINFDERNIRSLSVNDWTDIRKNAGKPRKMGEMTLNDLTSKSLRCQMRTNRKSGKCKEKQNIAGERFANHYPRRCKI